jgi:hypothetical protein
MNNPASDWLVLIRPSVAGFDSTRDITIPQFLVLIVTTLCAGSLQIRQL